MIPRILAALALATVLPASSVLHAQAIPAVIRGMINDSSRRPAWSDRGGDAWSGSAHDYLV